MNLNADQSVNANSYGIALSRKVRGTVSDTGELLIHMSFVTSCHETDLYKREAR